MSHSLGGYWRPWLVSSLRAWDGRCWLWTRMFMSVLGTWWGAQLRGLFLQQLVAWTAAAAVCKFAVNVGASLLHIDESPTTVFLDELWPYGVLLLIPPVAFLWGPYPRCSVLGNSGLEPCVRRCLIFFSYHGTLHGRSGPRGHRFFICSGAVGRKHTIRPGSRGDDLRRGVLGGSAPQ